MKISVLKFLFGKKSSENIIIYKISYKTSIGAKELPIRFDKINGFIRLHDRARYLVLFDPENYGVIHNRIRYVMGQKSIITFDISHNYAKIKVDSYDPLTLKKGLTLHNVMLIKSVFHKDQHHYYYIIVLEKCSYQSATKCWQTFFWWYGMLRRDEAKVEKEKISCTERTINVWKVHVDNMVIWNLIKYWNI